MRGPFTLETNPTASPQSAGGLEFHSQAALLGGHFFIISLLGSLVAYAIPKVAPYRAGPMQVLANLLCHPEFSDKEAHGLIAVLKYLIYAAFPGKGFFFIAIAG